MRHSVLTLLIFCGACSRVPPAGDTGGVLQVGPMTMMRDARDGQMYPLIHAAGRDWFARNLNFPTPESWCYGDDPQQCATVGRLYSLPAAHGACPAGWTLPSEAEWLALASVFGGYFDFIEKRAIGDPLKSYAALLHGGLSGFEALLGGSRSLLSGKYMDLDGDGMFWSSSGCGPDKSSFMVFNEHSRRLLRDCDQANFAGSVRCVRNAAPGGA